MNGEVGSGKCTLGGGAETTGWRRDKRGGERPITFSFQCKFNFQTVKKRRLTVKECIPKTWYWCQDKDKYNKNKHNKDNHHNLDNHNKDNHNKDNHKKDNFNKHNYN